jgi:dCTP deaminase
MILTKNEILKELKRKSVVIDPLDTNNIGPASIDLTLGEEFRLFNKQKKTLEVTDDLDYRDYTKHVKRKSIVLKPGELILGITAEQVTLPEDICGWLQGRSRFARMGLAIHITAPLIQPGVKNREVLEIFNAGPHPLKLVAGTRICQLSLQKMKGKAKYQGIFSKQ